MDWGQVGMDDIWLPYECMTGEVCSLKSSVAEPKRQRLASGDPSRVYLSAVAVSLLVCPPIGWEFVARTATLLLRELEETRGTD